MERIFENLFEFVSGIETIDTHEHLPAKESLRSKDQDVLQAYLGGYVGLDLVSAGLAPEALSRAGDARVPLRERWNLVAPAWEIARNTGYAQAIDLSVRKLYGIDGLRGDTLDAVAEAFKKSLAPGHYQRVLKDTCRIRVSLWDSWRGKPFEVDTRFFRPVCRPEVLVLPRSWGDIGSVGEQAGIPIRSFDDWLEASRVVLEQAFSAGAVAIKFGLAYHRPLRFERVTRHDAETDFNAVLSSRVEPDWDHMAFTVGRRFQDYMMHFLMGLADKDGRVVQFHTGLLAGPGNEISHSDPALLSNLFIEYPRVKFDVFHIGYPYEHVLGALAKAFPNVFIDMCWAHVISPVACERALSEWLESVPANKISAFGGDYGCVDLVAGHLELARRNVSRALAEKVRCGTFDADRAKEIARMLFFDNPLRLYGLEANV